MGRLTVEELIGEYTPKFGGEEKEYYFRFYGKANQSHLMETPEREPIFAAEMTKFSLFGKCDYDFIDYVNDTRTHHTIGKTVTKSVGSGNISATLASDFKVDDQKLYELLKMEGYSSDRELHLEELDVHHTIEFEDQVVGVIKGAGSCIMPNVKENFLSKNLKAPGLYKVYTSPENARLMFLWCLYFARAEQMVSE